MRRQWAFGFVLLFVASVAWGGSIGDPVPANPCPGAAPFKAKLAVLDVTSDGLVLCGATLADTAITCTIKEPDGSGATADLIVEYYDEFGAPMNSPPLGPGFDQQCGAPVGSSFTFTLSPLPPGPPGFGPWSFALPGFLAVPGGSCGAGCTLHGFARVFSSSIKVHCTGTRIDTSGFCFPFFSPSPPLTTKNLTVIKIPKQKGD